MTHALSGNGRHRVPLAERTKPLAVVLTGGVALATAVAGTVTLLRSEPAGHPSSSVTTTMATASTSGPQR